MKIWTFFDTFWSTIVEIFDCGGAGGTREGRREGRRGGRDRGLVAVGGAHLTHCAHIYAGRGGGGTGGGGGGTGGGTGGAGGGAEGRGGGGGGGALAALAYHPQELTSCTYLTAEGLVVEMEGPVEGLRGCGGTEGLWRD